MERVDDFGTYDDTQLYVKYEKGDGNCFFYAMTRGLHELYPEKYGDKSYMYIKKRLIQYYLEHLDELFASTEHGVEFAWYQFEQLQHSIENTKAKRFRIASPMYIDDENLGDVNDDNLKSYDFDPINLTKHWFKQNIDKKVNNILSKSFTKEDSACFLGGDSKRSATFLKKCILSHRKTILEEVPEIHVVILGLLQDNWYAGFRIISDLSKLFNIRPIILVGNKGSLKQSPIDTVEDKRDVIYFHYNGVNHFNSIYYETKDKKSIKHTKKGGISNKK